MDVQKIVFLCTGNSCRSQMAEGWARHLLDGIVEAASAGVLKHGIDPRAIQVMDEAGVDISGQLSKTIDELPSHHFDAVITLCDHANESCPLLPGQFTRLHQGFDDPPALARTTPDESSALQEYRRVRDEIRSFVSTLPDRLRKSASGDAG